MNHIFRTIWSIATQSWQAASELAKAAGKKSTKSLRNGALTAVITGLSLCHHAEAQPPPATNQLPTAGTIAHGTATISKAVDSQSASMTVNQSSQHAVVNWETFDLGSSATLNFVQPNSQAVILNRINGSNPSQIFGQINANGQVFITNANGVYFAPSASVNVGALVATTHSISDNKFMSGDYVFERNGATGKIINEGRISAALGGYVALLAPEVQNAGVVVAKAGTVAMAAGEMISLKIDGNGSLAGITTTPSAIATLIENKQAVQAPDGQIILSAVALNKLHAGVIKNSGTLEANSLVSKGGRIYLEGDDISLASTSKMEAKGATGGGTVLVGGDWQGSGDMRQATTVTMAAGAVIDASATQKGDGGKVVLWSDIHSSDSQTLVHGSILAEAGVSAGNGGKIETSGHKLNVNDALVSTKAPSGHAGSWLLDPTDFVIATSGGDMTGTQLGNLLASNSITIQSGTGTNSSTSYYGSVGGTLGNIKIGTGVTWGGNNNLTFDASGEIYGSGGITRTGSGSLTFIQASDSTNTGVYSGGYSGIISGTGSVTKSGVGTLLVSGANTYTGATIVSQGTLKSGRGFGTTSSGFGYNSAITVASGATLDGNNLKAQVGSLSGAGTINVGAGTGGANFSFGNDNQSAEFTGVITGARLMFITKAGTGTQTLSGLNTFLGYSYIDYGILKLGRSSSGTSGPLGTNAVSISSAGTLDLNGFTGTSNQTLVISGSLINSSSSDVTWTGPITGTTASIIASSGAINLVSTSAGGLGNSGATKYGITIGGKVSLGGLISLTASGIVLNGSGTQLTYAPTTTSPTLSAVISGTGDLVLNPTNPLLVTAASVNTYSGAFTVAGGIVKAAASTNFGASSNAITVSDGGALSLAFNASSASPFSRSITINGYGSGNYGALDYSSTTPTDFYYSGTVSLGSTARISETNDGNLRLTGTIQTSGYNFTDANSPHLITTAAIISGGGSKKTNTAFVGAYDATGNYSSTYGSTPSVSYQLYTSAAATSATSVADISGTAIFASGGSTVSATSAAGSYSLAYSSGLSSSTYALFPITAKTTWTIAKAPLTVTAAAASKTYGAANPTLTATISGYVNGETLTTAGISGAASATTTATASTSAGTATITASVGTLAATNYDFTTFVDGTLTINKAPLTVTATAASKTYDGSAYSGGNGVSYSGFVNSETSSALGGSVSYSGTSQGAVNAGSYLITPSGLTSSNYDISYSDGALTINKAPLTVTATAASKTYDGLAYSGGNGVSYSDLVNSETSAVLGGSVSYSGTSQGAVNAGSYLITPSGLTSSNYDISYSDGALTINKAPLSVTADNASKTYGAANPALTTTISGYVNGETLTTAGISGAASATTTATASTAAGTATITASVGTLAATNYDFTTFVDGTLTISASSSSSSSSAGNYDFQNMINGALTAYQAQNSLLMVANIDIPAANNSSFQKIANGNLTVNTTAPSSSSVNLTSNVSKPLLSTVSSQQPEDTGARPASQNTITGNTSLDAAPKITVAPAKTQSGILAVTFVDKSGGGSKTDNISFEQKADMISLENSTTPATAGISVSTDKMTFSGNLTTFLVGAPDGKMVEYQGGLVNNHIVIVAVSAEAKAVAKLETKLVLAAALTTLGRNDYIVLSQLDGFIIDMR